MEIFPLTESELRTLYSIQIILEHFRSQYLPQATVSSEQYQGYRLQATVMRLLSGLQQYLKPYLQQRTTSSQQLLDEQCEICQSSFPFHIITNQDPVDDTKSNNNQISYSIDANHCTQCNISINRCAYSFQSIVSSSLPDNQRIWKCPLCPATILPPPPSSDCVSSSSSSGSGDKKVSLLNVLYGNISPICPYCAVLMQSVS